MRWTRTLFWKWTDIVKDPIVDVTKGVAPSTKKYANLPESYIKRAMRQVHINQIHSTHSLQNNKLNEFHFRHQIEYETPRNNPRFLPKTIERRKFRFGMSRPWTSEFFMANYPYTHRKKVFVEPIGMNHLSTSIRM